MNRDEREPQWLVASDVDAMGAPGMGQPPVQASQGPTHDLWSFDSAVQAPPTEHRWGGYAYWPAPVDGAPVDEGRFVRCPFCSRWARRVRPGGAAVAVLVGLSAAALLVALAAAHSRLGPAVSWIVGVAWVLIGVGGPLLRRIAQPFTIPEDCPHCGGPMRMAVLSGWGSPEVRETAYTAPRWMPRE